MFLYFVAFEKCGKDNGLAVIFRCTQENESLKNCLSKWFYDEEFKEECKKQYLEERSAFRRTGISKKQYEASK